MRATRAAASEDDVGVQRIVDELGVQVIVMAAIALR
jgi:hypothetical protein